MKFINILLTLSLGYLLFSCGVTGEEFTLEKDGSGTVTNTMDMSSMWGFMQMGLQQELNNGEEREPGEQQFLELLTAENFDTTFSLVDFASNMAESQGSGPVGIGDLISEFENNSEMSEEQKEAMRPAVEMLATSDIRMYGNSSTGQYAMSTIQYFDEPSDVSSLMDVMSTMMDEMPNEAATDDPDAQQGLAMLSAMNGMTTQYRLDGNTLYVSRQAEEEAEIEDPQMAMMMSMMGGSDDDYVINLQLPGKIKKVSREAEIDKKAGMVKVVIPANELKSGFDFSVDFKPKR
ncbi:MAG: hypothetical protein AAF741_03405 [Bacteroidota bacterium]